MLKIAMLAGLVAAAPLPLLAEGAAPTMTIIGNGQFVTAPDMASFSLQVVSDAPTAREALTLNNARMQAVMEMLKDEGIEGPAVQTTGLSVTPRWQRIKRPQFGQDEHEQGQVIGYSARNGLSIRVNELDRLGAVLDAVVGNGADVIGGISFGLKDPAQALNEARRRSVADALQQAELYAEEAGVAIARISAVTPLGSSQPLMTKRGIMSMSFEDQSVPVTEGEVSVSADVNITFEIAPLAD